MWQMSLGIKFLREAKFRRQKNGKKKFGELSTEEIQVITDNAVPVTTKKATKFGIRIFNGTYPLFLPLCCLMAC